MNLFPCFPLFSAPVVAAFVFRCIALSYRLSGAFSSFSLYSPSFCSPLRLFRVFFILLFYFPYLTLFSRLFTSFSAPVVAAFTFRCITPSYRLFGAFSSFSFYSPSFCSRCGCSVFFSSFFFIFRILRSFPAFSPHFPHRLFLCFFLVPGRK